MDLVELLDQLVAIPSVSGNEKLLSKFLMSWVDENTSHEVKRVRDSLIVTVRGENRQNCMLFNGHFDTVAPGDSKTWKTDPYKLTSNSEELHGLGTSDMKGAIAVMLEMLRLYNHKQPPCDIIAMFVTEEETSSDGTKDSLEFLRKDLDKYDRKAVIVGEPTSLKVVLGHRGNVFVNVYFKGVGSHASRPPISSKQAIQKAIAFANSVPAKLEAWQKKHNDNLLGMPGVTVTQFKAGTGSINQVPTDAMVSLDVRTIPSLHIGIEREIKEWAEEYGGKAELLYPWPAGYCSPDEDLAVTAMGLVHQETILVTQGATDQQFFTQAGIPAIICGPGDKHVIHAPNEYIKKTQLTDAFDLYIKLVEAWAAGKHPSPHAVKL